MDKFDRYMTFGLIIFLVVAVIVLPLCAYSNGCRYGAKIAAINEELRTYQLSCTMQEVAINQQSQFIEALRTDLNRCIELRYEWNESN